MLENLIGEDGVDAYEAIKEIAEGRLTFAQLSRKPRPDEDAAQAALIPMVEVKPSIRERLDAWTFLVEQLNGKAPSSLDISVEHTDNTSAPNYRALSDADLANLHSLLLKANAALPAETVEGEIVEVEPVEDLEPDFAEVARLAFGVAP